MFSIVTVPSNGFIFSAHGRPTASKAPPGGNGTTRRIGRDGYDCAQLSRPTIVNADAAPKRRVNSRRLIGIVVLPARRETIDQRPITNRAVHTRLCRDRHAT